MSNSLAKTNLQTQVATSKPSALKVMATRLSVDPDKLMETLKATVFQKATNEEMLALVVVANEYQLNPFLKEIYAFPAKGGGIVPIVSVDGWNKMLIRQDAFDGIEFEFEREDEHPVSCTATVHVKGRAKPCRITEYFDECKRNTDNWNNMPHRMLRNRTLCQAARMAFGFSGVYHEEEAPIDVVAEPPRIVRVEASANVLNDKPEETPQQQLAKIVVEAGHTFDDFTKWATASGQIEDASKFPDFDSLPTELSKRLIRAKAGLINGMKAGAA